MHARGILTIAAVLALWACVPRPAPALLHGVPESVQAHLEAMQGATGEGRLQPADPARIACLVEHLTIPGALTLAGLGARPTTGEGTGPAETVPAAITYEQALETLTRGGRLPFDEAQGREALEILRSGRWRADFATALASLLDLAHQAPALAAQDVSSLDQLPGHLGVGILRDVTGLLAYRRAASLTLVDPDRLREVPEGGRHTLAVLAGTATYGELAKTSGALLANDSVRLALLVYARSQGIELEPDDLDRVREVLEGEEPSLAPLVTPAVEALVRRHAGVRGVELLGRMSREDAATLCRTRNRIAGGPVPAGAR